MLGLKSHKENWFNYIRAGSWSCSADALAELANSEIERIRRRVAENPQTPPNILERLASDPSPEVRVAAALNRAAPAHILTSLINDPDPNVRMGLAEDLNTPPDIINRLCADANPYISCRAQQTRQLQCAAAARADSNCCYQFIRRSATGEEQPERRYA